MDCSDSFEPIPVHGELSGLCGEPEAVSVSPETVGEDEEPVEGSSPRRQSKRHRASPGSTRKKLPVPKADEGGEKSDGDEEEDADGSGGEEDALRTPGATKDDVDGVVVKAEVLDEEFPGATARGNPIFWYISYQRPDNKGRDQTLLAGPVRFNARARALVWTGLFRLDVGDIFSLSGFVNTFSDFARGRPGVFLVPTVSAGATAVAGGDVLSVPGANCPIPGFRPESHQTVRCRAARASRFPGASVPRSLVEVTFSGRTAASSRTAYVLYSAWFEEPRAVARLVNDWDRMHPNAPLQTVDELLLQVRMPTAPAAMAADELRALAEGVNYEAPAGARSTNAPPLPEL